MRIISKEQVTIPQEIRERIGLLPLVPVWHDFTAWSARIQGWRSPTLF